MQLYTYFRSSAAYRVRIALHLKGIGFESNPIQLAHGEQFGSAYRKLNPQARVPTLVEGELVLAQSLAQLEYLEERFPEPPLLPREAEHRARVRALAYLIACDVHPLQNLSVGNYLTDTLGLPQAQRLAWCQHWIACGLDALECLVADDGRTGHCCHGDMPGMADLCLVPQLYNARRFECETSRWPTLERIESYCLTLPAFERAHPARQPDTPDALKKEPLGSGS